MNRLTTQDGWLKGSAADFGIHHVTGDDAPIMLKLQQSDCYDRDDLDVEVKHPRYSTMFKLFQFPLEIRITLRSIADPIFFYCIVQDRDGEEEMRGPYDTRAEADYAGQGALDELKWVSWQTIGEAEL